MAIPPPKLNAANSSIAAIIIACKDLTLFLYLLCLYMRNSSAQRGGIHPGGAS
jgi:hypothetical protein